MAEIDILGFLNTNPNKEDETTIDEVNISNLTSSDTEQIIENEELNFIQKAGDVTASAATKYATGLTYVIDLPFILVDALDAGSSYVFNKVAKAAGFDSTEVKEIEGSYLSNKKENKIRPGEYIRDNFLTYESKTPTGEVVGSMAEFASPGILAKGTKAKTTLSATGAASGAAKAGIEMGTGNEALAYGLAVPLNIGLDLYALSRGNASVLGKYTLPNDAIIRKARTIQADANKYGLKLTAGEATGSAAVQSVEGTMTSLMVGDAVFDKFWQSRPAQLKNYIFNWGKANGLITAKDTTTMYKQLKKAAIALQNQRGDAWKLAGGTKIKNFTYDSQSLDNLSITFMNLAKESSPEVSKILTRQSNKIKELAKTGKNGQALHNLYTTLRDTTFDVSGKTSTIGSKVDLEVYKKATEAVKEILSSNKNWSKAQEKYITFTKKWAEPLTDGSVTKLFKDLSDAKTATKTDTVATLYKYLNSDTLSAKELERLAASINKSKVPNLWNDVASTYFSNMFNKAAIDGLEKGKRIGMIFHDSIMKNPRQKDNFVEILFQVAKNNNKNVNRADIVKSVNSFANVLKASSYYAKVGSQTAARTELIQDLKNNPISQFIGVKGGLPVLSMVGEWFQKRTFTKSSEEIARAMISDKGIDALVELAANWKDKAKAVSFVRAITIGSSQLDEEMNN